MVLAITCGITFTFGGVPYTTVRILANGALHFGANQGFHKDYTNEALPITGALERSTAEPTPLAWPMALLVAPGSKRRCSRGAWPRAGGVREARRGSLQYAFPSATDLSPAAPAPPRS